MYEPGAAEKFGEQILSTVRGVCACVCVCLLCVRVVIRLLIGTFVVSAFRGLVGQLLYVTADLHISL